MFHEGKEDIIIFEDSLVRGNPKSAWPRVFSLFDRQIKARMTSEGYDAIMGDFSTSTDVSKIVNVIVLMEAMDNFFTYRVHTRYAVFLFLV